MKVSISFTIDIDATEWEGRHKGIPVPADITDPAVADRIRREVNAHAENVITDLYIDQGWALPAIGANATQIFVGYDDITDYVWDSLDDGVDYNGPAIVEAVIAQWPSLIGWHQERAVQPAVEAIIDLAEFNAILEANRI